MRVLASSVLVMEALTMGFALLIAMNSSDGWTVLLGAVVAILLLFTPGLLKKRSGWILGSILQFFLVGYGAVVTMMYFLGGIDRKSTRLNSSHEWISRMPSSA